MNTYTRGAQTRLSVTITVGGAATDPTALTLRIRRPTGAVTSHVYGVDGNVVKSATGAYYYDLTLDIEGAWFYRWEATGAAVGAVETELDVQRGQFA